MGWTSLHRDRGMTDRQFFEKEFPETLIKRGEVLACGSVQRSTFYAAVRDKDTGKVWALVVLMRWNPKDHFNFSYKDLTETCGPVETSCPKKVFRHLTPTEDKYALEWRAKVTAWHEKREAAAQVKPGTIIRLDRALPFTDGSELDLFRFVKGSRFTSLEHGGHYRISHWRDRAFTIITDVDELMSSMGMAL